LLSACGGGGGDATPAPPPSTVAITSSNQATITRATMDGGLALAQSQTAQVDDRRTAQSVATAAPRGHVSAIDTAVRRVIDGVASQRRTIASADARPSTVSSDTLPCGVSGSMTLSFDDHDNTLGLSAGDSVTISLAQCSDSADDLMNGTMVMTLSNVASATDTRIEFTGTMAFQQMSVVIGATSVAINGSVAVSAVETSTHVQTVMDVGAGGLTVAVTSPSYNDTIVYESGMHIATDETTTSPNQVVTTLNGSFTATSIGGRVSVATQSPIIQLAVDAYPTAGQLLITGAAGSKLRITVIDATQLELQLDADADGTYEATTLVPWGTLMPV
jgi:hypothetical protein